MDALLDLADIPQGVFKVRLSKSNQILFNLVINQQISEADPIRFIKIRDIMRNIEEKSETSPFFEIKDEIMGCTEEEIVISYDHKSKFGGNFFVCVSPFARNWLLSRSKSTVTASEKEEITDDAEETTFDSKLKMTGDIAEDQQKVTKEEEDEAEEIPFVPYSPPVPKEWICGGSDLEIDDEIVKEVRPKFTLIFQKEVKYYDSEKAPELSTRHVLDSRFGYIECPAYEDLNFGLQRLEIDTAVQVASVSIDAAVQTTYRYPKNAWVQTAPREMALEEIRELEQSDKLKQFLDKVMPRLMVVLQQNELMDVFEDEWLKLGPVDFLHGKVNNEIKEYQSFSDLQFSKDKLVTSAAWHPLISGIVAVACVDRLTFDSRVDKTSKLLLQTSLVLLWSIKDPIHPQLLLEAPDEVQCIAFNPLAGHLLVGGCSSGQICLWDLSDYMEKLKQQKPVDVFSFLLQEVKFVEPPPLVPTLRYAAGTAMEYSHTASVEDIFWLPDHLEIESRGVAIESEFGFCYQLMSCGLDCIIHFWDIRPDKQLPPDARIKSRDREFPIGIPTTFQFLDAVWRPIYSFELFGVNQVDKIISTRISIHEMQSYRTPLSPFTINPPAPPPKETEPEDDEEHEKEERHFNTMIFIGSLDGNIAGVDWVSEKDGDGKTIVKTASFTEAIHGGPVSVVEHSPFLRNIVLTVGMWRFAIWREEQVNDPLLIFRSPSKRLLAAKWSRTRPSVFFVGKEDGTLDVWDFQDRSHEPIIMYPVSAAPITAIDVHPNPQNSKDHMLAVADSVGVLHLLVLPPYLTHPIPNELETLEEFFSTEVDCVNYRTSRKKFHQSQRTGKSQSVKELATPKFRIEEAESVEDVKYTLFKEYLKVEKHCFSQLGIAETKDITVPDQNKDVA